MHHTYTVTRSSPSGERTVLHHEQQDGLAAYAAIIRRSFHCHPVSFIGAGIVALASAGTALVTGDATWVVGVPLAVMQVVTRLRDDFAPDRPPRP